MAIYHLSARAPIRRADGRCATAAAAYRAGCVIVDDRTGTSHDYRRRSGVVSARLLLPGGAELADRSAFWNGVERHHRRRDAVVAREVVVALPAELPEAGRAALAHHLAAMIADRFHVAVDCAIHAPSGQGDDRNHHAHLLLPACQVNAEGTLGSKAVLLDPIHCRRNRIDDAVSWLRPAWEALANAALAKMGSQARIDHRSHAKRGIGRRPTGHVGIGPGAGQRRYRNSIHKQRNLECAEIDRTINRLKSLRRRLQDAEATSELPALERRSARASTPIMKVAKQQKPPATARPKFRTQVVVANLQQPAAKGPKPPSILAKLLSRLKTPDF